MITEGKATISIAIPKIVSKDMPVFYNPVMKHNRDISILVLKHITQDNLRVCLPMEATGIRAIRFLKELPKSKIQEIVVNDIDKQAYKSIKKNLLQNRIKSRITVKNQDANILLRTSEGFDYIDIDPFGTPNPFLDSAMVSLARNGILAVTATDTSALCGASPKACQRKYWAQPIHDHRMHEFGLRILIRKVQLVAAQYNKALVPIYSYSKDHYMRIFFQNKKGKMEVDNLLKLHGLVDGLGPFYLGSLFDVRLAKSIANDVKNDPELKRFTGLIAEELQVVGFFDLHEISKRCKVIVPRNTDILNALKHRGFKASLTHFSPLGVKSTAPEKEIIEIVKSSL